MIVTCSASPNLNAVSYLICCVGSTFNITVRDNECGSKVFTYEPENKFMNPLSVSEALELNHLLLKLYKCENWKLMLDLAIKNMMTNILPRLISIEFINNSANTTNILTVIGLLAFLGSANSFIKIPEIDGITFTSNNGINKFKIYLLGFSSPKSVVTCDLQNCKSVIELKKLAISSSCRFCSADLTDVCFHIFNHLYLVESRSIIKRICN